VRQPIFVDGVKDWEMSTTTSWVARSLNKALNQTLQLQAAMAAAGPPERLWEAKPWAAKRTQSTVTEHRKTGTPYYGSVGIPVI
jgi:hypothetical protein